jgi:DNA-binding HxlR family transcriptional regulator
MAASEVMTGGLGLAPQPRSLSGVFAPGGQIYGNGSGIERQAEMDHAENSMSEIEIIRTLFETKWRFDVIQKLCESAQRLSTLERSVPNASKKMLIDTLHGLEELGWISRSDLSTDLKHVQYSLATAWEQRIRHAVEKITAQQGHHKTNGVPIGPDEPR